MFEKIVFVFLLINCRDLTFSPNTTFINFYLTFIAKLLKKSTFRKNTKNSKQLYDKTCNLYYWDIETLKIGWFDFDLHNIEMYTYYLHISEKRKRNRF